MAAGCGAITDHAAILDAVGTGEDEGERQLVDGVRRRIARQLFVTKAMEYCMAQRYESVNNEVWIDPSKDFYEEAIREAVLLHPPQRYALFLKMFESTKRSPTFGYDKQLQQDQDHVRRICREMYSEMDKDPIAWGALSQGASSNRVSTNNDNNITRTNDDSNTTVVYSHE